MASEITNEAGRVVERLREGAIAFDNDATPSQVGPNSDELREAAILIEYQSTSLTAQAAEIARLKQERDEAREYAFEATKAITSLTVGGSEFFTSKLGDNYKANLPACIENIRQRTRTLHDQLTKGVNRATAAEAKAEELAKENRRLREALTFADEQTRKLEALLEPHVSWRTALKESDNGE